MKIFRFGHAIRDSQQQENQAARRENEAADFDLAGTGGFLSVVKYAVYSVLAALNWRLFHTTIPSIWGIAVACVAILSEGFAIYCWHKQIKSAGGHKTTLRIFAVGFTVVSFVHACASLYEISGAGASIGKPLWIYSYFVAFPLIFSGMLAGVCLLYYNHWSTKISEDRAKALMEAEKSRAALLTEKVQLANQMEVERARLGFFKDQVRMEEEYVQAVEELAIVKARGQTAINSIPDPEVRAEILAVLGRVNPNEPPKLGTGQPPTANQEPDQGKGWRH
jgi:cation transport ATPase